MIGSPIIITNSEGKILLGKRSDNLLFYPSLWGLPGGVLEKETMEDSVKREAKEELGVDVEIIKRSENIYENLPNKKCSIHTIDIVYYCKIINGEIPEPKDETSKVGWFNPYEIEKMKLAYNHKQILKEEGLLKIIQTSEK